MVRLEVKNKQNLLILVFDLSFDIYQKTKINT